MPTNLSILWLYQYSSFHENNKKCVVHNYSFLQILISLNNEYTYSGNCQYIQLQTMQRDHKTAINKEHDRSLSTYEVFRCTKVTNFCVTQVCSQTCNFSAVLHHSIHFFKKWVGLNREGVSSIT